MEYRGPAHAARYPDPPVHATPLFLTSINLTSYYARTQTPGAGGTDASGTSYRGRFDYNTDRYGAAAEHS